MSSESIGFKELPLTAKVLAGLFFALFAGGTYWIFDGGKVPGGGTITGSVIGAFLAGSILLAGYVYADAGRRGMPAGLWTALAVLVPNGIGFLLYFLLRKPMTHPCANCAFGVGDDAGFCPRCGAAQRVNGGLKSSVLSF